MRVLGEDGGAARGNGGKVECWPLRSLKDDGAAAECGIAMVEAVEICMELPFWRAGLALDARAGVS